MLFGELESGDSFIFPCSKNDEKVTIYTKLEKPVIPSKNVDPNIFNAFTAFVHKATANLVHIPDDTEIIPVKQ